jgi:phage minor structural protein|nr:MAG TPA: tail protein [Caudoviricetes sp.]
MIQVYLSTNTNFDKNGDMSLQPLSYEVSTAGINQAVEFTIEHEIDEYGRYEYLQKGNVIKAFTPWDLKKGQLFRIEDIDKDSKEGTIIASGYLIFYDNVKTYVKDFNNENVLICDTGNTTGEEAIKKIFKNTNYIGHSNIMRISRSRLERKNIVAALTGDDENSFVNRWGGELFIDNFDIYMNEKIGHDTGLIISYGRNMEYIKESSSYKNTITRIIPIGFDGLRLTGKTPWVDSPNINKYPYIMEKEIKFDQVKVKEENSDEGFETIEEARAELIRLSNLLFEEEQIDSPEVSIEVSMYDLQGTLEYESYECYEEVNLGDYIKARHEILNIDTLVRCIGYTWDGIALKYKTIKLGHQIDNYFDKQTDIYNKVNNILNSDGSVNAVEVAGILNAINVTMKACRDTAQPLPVRVMVCEDFDKDSPSYGAMCFGSMGFMIASERTPDDKDWDWRTFGTGKGFFADLIVAGILNANLIRAGIIESLDKKTWINLETGDVQITGTVKSQRGYQYVSLDSGGITLQDHHKLEQMLRIATSYFSANRDFNGTTFAMPQFADFLRIAHIEKSDLTDGWSETDIQNIFMDIWTNTQKVGNTLYKKGITFYKPVYIKDKVSFFHGTNHEGDILSVNWIGIEGLLGFYGDNGSILGYKSGESYKAAIAVTEDSVSGDNINTWGNVNCNGGRYHNGFFIGNHANAYSNSITRSYSETNCIETEEKQVRFNFENVEIKNGKAILNIPKRYLYINNGYIISSIIKKGKGNVWIGKEEDNRFIIEADDDIKVNIEIIIKMSDYTNPIQENTNNGEYHVRKNN